MPGGEQVEQLLLGIEAVRIVLGGKVLQRRRCLRRDVGRRRRGERGRPDREEARGREVLPLARRGDERRDQPAARCGGLAGVAAELEVLVGQPGEIQSFQIAAKEGEMLQADPALGGRLAACCARARLAAGGGRRAAGVVAWRGVAGSSRNSTSSTSGSSAVVMGGFERGTESMLFDTSPAVPLRRLDFDFVGGRPMK
ncbi:hypothetical protein [Burkholderia ubonensis]|uniref:hypothetical protein n=1 Tax=Burkholderia ubonensis TaxID=101571 RepID=UPI000AFEE57C|nr:hypothetical protein [Burkholderia ubonensis]